MKNSEQTMTVVTADNDIQGGSRNGNYITGT